MRYFVLIGVALGAACGGPDRPSLASAHRTAIEDSVRTLMSTLAGEVSATGFVAWLPYLERSERFVWTADGAVEFPTADSLDRFIRGFAATLSHTELAFDEPRVSALGPGVAQVATKYRELFVGRSADTTRIDGVFVGVWANTPAGWRLVSGHTSHAAKLH